MNPYITGNPVGNTPAFVGRTKILQEVLDIVRHPKENAIVLYGQRRIGKTSVLFELEAILLKEGAYHPVFFNLENKAEWPLGSVLQELADRIYDKLKTANLDLAVPNLKRDPEIHFRQWLVGVLDNLPKTSLVLLFDEFDVLANVPNSEQAAKAFFPYLRELLTTNTEQLNFIFATGRKVDDLNSITLALFRNIPIQHVSLLNKEETLELVHISDKGLHWSNEAIEKVWHLTNGHPLLTQTMCSHVWKRLYQKNASEIPTVTLKDVEQVIPETLQSSDNNLQWLWDGLPIAERAVASVLAEAGVKSMIDDTQLKQILSERGVPVRNRELHNAPHLLQEWDLIEAMEKGYRFHVELIRRWIAKNKPLHQVQNEWDRLDSNADMLYHVAQNLYKDRRLPEARKLLEQAIELNPHHLKNHILLADILLEIHQPKEACERLERLEKLKKNPIARNRLIEALLALAKSEDSKKEQLKLYERVLELEQNHSEAKTQKQNILQQQQAKRQRPLEIIKNFYHNYSKRVWQVCGIVLAFVVSSLVTKDFPSGILLEVEVEMASDGSRYSLTGVPSSENYLLGFIQISYHSGNLNDLPTFEYDIYKPIELTAIPKTITPVYWINKELLQTKLEIENQAFQYPFAQQKEDERFIFSFLLDDGGKKVDFTCQAATIDKSDISCQVKEKGYISILRGIPWYHVGSVLGIFWIFLFEIIFAFKRKQDDNW
jgi:tetratricopeptide (TPR) repeat protein